MLTLNSFAPACAAAGNWGLVRTLIFARRNSYLVAALGLALGACSPSSSYKSGDARAVIEVRRDHLGLSANATDMSLPDRLCYAVHVTGHGLEQVSGDELSCGPSTGLGVMSVRAYNKGDTAEVTVKVGEKRRFDLIAFESPLGVTNGRANCGELSVEYKQSDLALERKILLKVNGQLVTAKPVLLATGEAAIEPGNNNVAIQAVPLVSAPITQSMGLAFGAPYNRADAGFGTPAACSAVVANPNKLFTPTSAALAAPVVSTTGGRRLQAVSGTPFLMLTPKTSVSARRDLASGPLEIRSRAGR